MLYRIDAELRFAFSEPVREHHIQLRLAPREDGWQKVNACSVLADPFAEPIRHRDGFGNTVHCLAFVAAHAYLSIKLQADVETLLFNPFDFEAIAPERELDWIKHNLEEDLRLWDFVQYRRRQTTEVSDFVPDAKATEFIPGRPLIGQVQDAMYRIARSRLPDQAPEDDMETSPGCSLQERYAGADLAQGLIALVRGWGIPCRFVIGYVDPGYFGSVQEDADHWSSAPCMHAWAEVLIPGAGWRGFDPEGQRLVNDTYVRVAAGRDVLDVPMQRTVFKGEGGETAVRFLYRASRCERLPGSAMEPENG